MVSTSKAQNEVNSLKDFVIGIFKVRNKFHLVMNHDVTNNRIDLMTITDFGVIQQEFNCPIEMGKLYMFPNNQRMTELLNKPFEWAEFCKQLD